jgi:multidrug resistance efflux pump
MAIRYGGSWHVRWPIRTLVLLVIVLVGMLPYKYEVGGQCRIVPTSEFGVRSQLQDELQRIYARDGDSVEANGVIAKLVGRDSEAERAEAKADVDDAEAFYKMTKSGFRAEDIAAAEDQVASLTSALTFADAELKRQKDLLSRSAAATNEYEHALSTRDSTKANLAAAQSNYDKLRAGYRAEEIDQAAAKLAKAKAQLHLAEQKCTLTEIRSPIRGTLATPTIEMHEGQAIFPGDLIAIVQDRSTLYAQILADEAAAAEVQPGMEVKIRLWGNYGELLTGKVERVAISAVSEASSAAEPFRTDRESSQTQQRYPDDHWRYVRILAKFEDTNVKLLPGMTGEARIVVADDCFWATMWRDVRRIALVEVWSWLP